MAKPGKILVSGGNGQLGRDLVSILGNSYEVTGIDIDDVDICSSNNLLRVVRQVQPDLIIHAAAYTAVDECEENEEIAMAVNGKGTENIARAAAEVGARLFYYSTDYVFDGSKATPYSEDDETGPLTAYGRSKLAGETAVLNGNDDSLVIRIAWVYGRHGQNFVRTMLRLGHSQLEQKRSSGTAAPIRVVNDQYGNPTWTEEIARQTERLIRSDLNGIVHATSGKETTWFKFADEIFNASEMPVDLIECTTQEYPRPAPRPRRSSLDNKRLRDVGMDSMRDYDIALKEYLEKYGESLCQ